MRVKAYQQRTGLTAQRGFSLLEVLVAFAILSLTLVVLLRIFSGALRLGAATVGYSHALQLGESKIAAISSDTSLHPGEQTGVDRDGFRWRTVVETLGLSAATPSRRALLQPLKVTVHVVWNEGARQRGLKLTTVRLERWQ